MKVRFLSPAEIEMLEASAYYEIQATNLGDDFLNIIEEAVNEISPTNGHGDDGHPRCNLKMNNRTHPAF